MSQQNADSVARRSVPHSFMGTVEAEQVLRLLTRSDSEADHAIAQHYTATFGEPRPVPAMATVRDRLRRAAEDALRWHGQQNDGSSP